MGPEKTPSKRSGSLGWLSALFTEAFASHPSISAARYAANNAIVGIALAVVSLLKLMSPTSRNAPADLVLGAMGLVLCAGLLLLSARPAILVGMLVLHGAILATLAIGLAITSVRWAFQAPPLSSFHYLPGVTLVVLTYGALQIAAFGPWPKRSRRIRAAGMGVGLILELAVLVSLAIRASR
jgi:hypothetical protein